MLLSKKPSAAKKLGHIVSAIVKADTFSSAAEGVAHRRLNAQSSMRDVCLS